MAYYILQCKTTNPTNTGNTLVFYPFPGQYVEDIWYIKNGYSNATNSTADSPVNYQISCAHSNWTPNNDSITIAMDNVLRNAINSKLNSGGLINLQNYLINQPEFQGHDISGNNATQIFGYLCPNRSVSGSFDITQMGFWEGNWPINFPTDVQYSYNIPNVGTVSDTVTVLTDGWYTREDHECAYYGPGIRNHMSDAQIMSPPSSWNGAPFNMTTSGVAANMLTRSFAYYTINGIYSRNAGSRNCYIDNAADRILNAGSKYFGGLTKNDLVNIVGAPNSRTYIGHPSSITNNVIMAITDVNFVDNTITVKFAMQHDKRHSMVAFITNGGHHIVALRVNYNFPVTTIRRPVDNWAMTFIEKSDFNPTSGNGTGSSALVWSSTDNSVTITAGIHVNNSNGFAKIISRHQGSLACSCVNNNGTIRLTIGGYSITIPSNVSYFYIKIISVNNNRQGYWKIVPPGLGMSHAFTITFPEVADAPIVSFNNEIYSAIVQALNTPNMPFLFSIMEINEFYTINVTGTIRCDVVTKDGKSYYAVSVYDVNGDFSALIAKNGTYVTSPVTITIDLSIVNNTVLIKAGMSTLGYTSTSIGDIPLRVDAIAVMLPAIATVSKNGARIGYATTTVNQSTFAFSFSALKEEVEQTDDFVSHYLG